MENTTDDKIAVTIVKETQTLFPSFNACSFDKGFHSPANQTELKAVLDQVTLPKKGKRSKKEEERETGEAFVAARKAHSAVESGINALEVPYSGKKTPHYQGAACNLRINLDHLLRNCR